VYVVSGVLEYSRWKIEINNTTGMKRKTSISAMKFRQSSHRENNSANNKKESTEEELRRTKKGKEGNLFQEETRERYSSEEFAVKGDITSRERKRRMPGLHSNENNASFCESSPCVTLSHSLSTSTELHLFLFIFEPRFPSSIFVSILILILCARRWRQLPVKERTPFFKKNHRQDRPTDG
jgi:hypothetical protein